MLYMGTSGFSYNDWVGEFYPPAMPKREWLIYYAREFNTCEINSTYYAIPGKLTMESMLEKTGEDFKFVIKANRQMTHERGDNAAVFDRFRSVLEPLIAGGKFGCILAQFPYSFKPGRESREYLKSFRERTEGLPVVVEFRNAQWLAGEVFDWLRELELGFCCVDEPQLSNLMPPLAEVTSSIGYVRFHGRNYDKWWQHEHAYERYDYTYSLEELEDWLPRLRKLTGAAENTFIFANNHWQAQSINTIRQLRLMLD